MASKEPTGACVRPGAEIDGLVGNRREMELVGVDGLAHPQETVGVKLLGFGVDVRVVGELVAEHGKLRAGWDVQSVLEGVGSHC